jgi:hypothetical protein
MNRVHILTDGIRYKYHHKVSKNAVRTLIRGRRWRVMCVAFFGLNYQGKPLGRQHLSRDLNMSFSGWRILSQDSSKRKDLKAGGCHGPLPPWAPFK